MSTDGTEDNSNQGNYESSIPCISSTPKSRSIPSVFIIPSEISSVSSTSSSNQFSASEGTEHPLSLTLCNISQYDHSNYSTTSSSTITSINGNNSEEDSDETQHITLKKVTKTQDWRFFKPMYDRLYKTVTTHPENACIKAEQWVNQYQCDSSTATTDLLQFFVDICGYQQFNISEIFNYQNGNYNDIVLYMEGNPTELQKTGKYLMKASSSYAKQSQFAIYKFINNLINFLNRRRMLHAGKMLEYLVAFLSRLTQSNHRVMVHTGLVIVMKLYTALTEIFVENAVNSSNQDTFTIYEKLNVLQLVIENKCDMLDDALLNMKLVCIQEMWRWFKLNPKLISHTKYFKRLLGFVRSKFEKIRIAALNVCYKLVRTTQFAEYLRPRMKDFIFIVGNRFNDINDNVIMSTFNVFNQLITNYPDVIPQKMHDNIILMMFGNSREFAIESGKFVITYLEANDFTAERKPIVIRRLIQLSQKIEKKGPLPLLIESILPNSPEICDWDLIIDMLINGGLDRSSQVKLLHIMGEIAYQILIGKSRICRDKSYQKTWSVEDIRRFSSTFLANIDTLLTTFSERIDSLTVLIDTLLIIDFEDKTLSAQKVPVERAMRMLRGIFVKLVDVKLLHAVSEVFFKLCAENSIVKLPAKTITSTIQQSYVDILLNYNKINMTDNIDDEDLEKFELNLLRLSSLIKFHNMTDMINFKQLFNNWLVFEEKFTSDSLKYIILCGCWHLIWLLRNLIKMKIYDVKEISTGEILEVSSHNSVFLKICFVTLKGSKDVVHNAALESICDLTLIYNQELRNLDQKSNAQFKEVIPAMDPDYCTQLINLIPQLIFNDYRKSTLKWRRGILVKMLNMMSVGIIPIENMAYLYKYYGSHDVAYADIFNENFQSCEKIENGTLLLVSTILRAMTLTFEDIVQKKEPWDNLSILSKKLQSFLFLTQKPDVIVFFMQLGITYALNKSDRYSFLNYLKLFGIQLPPGEKDSILEYFNEKTKSLKKNDIFYNFIVYIQRTKMKIHPARTQSSSSIGSSTSEKQRSVDQNNYTIEEDSQ